MLAAVVARSSFASASAAVAPACFASVAAVTARRAASGFALGSDQSVISQWLSGARDVSDIQYFLKHFGESAAATKDAAAAGAAGPKTAVIKIGGAIVEEEMHILAPAVSLLYRLGISPIVIHGGGPQLNKLLENAGIVPEYQDGMRVTDADTLKIAQRVFNEANKLTIEGLSKAGIPCAPCTSGVLYADVLDYSKWKLVGKTTGANSKLLNELVGKGIVPVITSLAQDKTGQTLNINADIAACEVAKAVNPISTVFLNSTGGIPGEKGQIIETINIHKEFDHLMGQAWVKYGTRLKIKEFKELLEDLPKASSVTITSTDHLTRSLLFGKCAKGTTVSLGRTSRAAAALGGNAAGARSFSTSAAAAASAAARAATKSIGVGIIGARGYVGRELIRLLGDHSALELRCVGSRANAGQKLADHIPEFKGDLRYEALPPDDIAKHANDVSVWVLALPNGHCGPYVEAIRKLSASQKDRKIVTVDLSGDNRFTDEWQYGLPERFRERIASASFISNPGCYATGAQLSILPLADVLAPNNPPAVFGISGYSGAGTTPSEKNDVNYLKDNIVPYSLVNHLHEREVSRQVGSKVNFMPHVAPFFQGITLTTDIRLNVKLTREQVVQRFQDMFGKEPLIEIVAQKDAVPVVKDNAQKHFVRLGGFAVDPATNRVVVVATLDNLLKGAATQALQNINIALGLRELDGIQSE